MKKYIVLIVALIVVFIISFIMILIISPKTDVDFYKMGDSSGDMQFMVAESIFEERWHVTAEDSNAIRLAPHKYKTLSINYTVKNKMPFSVWQVEVADINYKHLRELGVVGYMTKQFYPITIAAKTDGAINVVLIIQKDSKLDSIKENITFNVIAYTPWSNKRRLRIGTY